MHNSHAVYVKMAYKLVILSNKGQLLLPIYLFISENYAICCIPNVRKNVKIH